MSIKSALVGLLLFFSAIGLAYYLQVNLGGDVYSKRDPASESDIHLKNLKSEILRPKKGDHHVHTEKLRGPLRLVLTGPDEKIKSNTGALTLTLKLESEENLPLVKVKWALPEGVRLISGLLEEEVSLEADVPLEISIHLQTLTDDNHQIHVHASSAQEAIGFAEIAQYNTVFEPYLKSRSKEDALQKSSVESEGPATVLKVFE